MNRPWQEKTVLVVDDSPPVRDEIVSLFEQIGCHVLGVAENGVEALAKVDELNPDIVSLDIIMPEMDGVECYRKITAKADGRVVFFISALASDPRVVACYEKEIEARAFMAKPATVASLEEHLRQLFKPRVQIPPPAPSAIPEASDIQDV